MTKQAETTAEDQELVYQVRLPLSTATLRACTQWLRAHLKQLGSRWRKLPAGRIVTLVLAHLRHDQRLRDLAGGNRVSASTLKRWVDEMVGVLARRAERLDRALKKIADRGGQVVLLDGTLIRTLRRTGRTTAASTRRTCLLFLALTDDVGNLVWISRAFRGAASEITAARGARLLAHLRSAGLGALADRGFVGLDTDLDAPVLVTGTKKKRKTRLTETQRIVNRLIAADRAVNEHGFAYLKNWRILAKLRCDLARATTLLRALLVLTRMENTR